VSIWSKDGSRKLNNPALAEKEAVKLLAGVGGDCEWWIYACGAGSLVGYLRVPVTEAEFAVCPAGNVVADAGDAGPQRPRTRGKAGTDSRSHPSS